MGNILNFNVQDLFVLAVKYLTESIDAKDKYTSGHSDRVRLYAVKVAEYIGLSKNEISTVYLASQLHDVGKAKISEHVLKKKGILSREETLEMEKHVIYAQHILSKHPLLQEVNIIVKHHHERWDGSGYPGGLTGENIPLVSRIIGICDSYDAMTTNRVYRRRKRDSEAVRELIAHKGTLYDPKFVDAFVALFEAGEIEYLKGMNFSRGFETNAWGEAVKLFKRAEKKFKDPERKYSIELKMLEIHNKMKQLDQSLLTIRKLEQLSSEHGIAINDKFLNENALYHYYKKEFDEVINISEMILSNRHISPLEHARALRHLAMSYWKLNKKEAALVEMSYCEEIYKELSGSLMLVHDKNYSIGLKYFELLDENYQLYEEISLNLAKMHDVQARIQFDLGAFNKALKYYDLSLDLKHDLDDSYGLSISHGGKGKLLSAMGRYEAAEQNFLMNLRTSRNLEIKRGIYLVNLERAKTFVHWGKLRKAKTIISELKKQFEQTPEIIMALVMIDLQEDNREKMEKKLSKIDPKKLKDPRCLIEYYRLMGQLYRKKDLHTAIRYIEDAAAISQQDRFVYLEIELRSLLAEIYSEHGETAKSNLQLKLLNMLKMEEN